ncbi:MAG: outer membrane beta-barrel protein [Lacibacter sp.]
MLRKLLSVTSILILSFFSVKAQDSTGKLTISGSVDAYYRFNFLNAKDSGHYNNKTSFTNSQNSFELGMASIKAEYAIGKVSAVADLGFGTRAAEFSYNDAGTLAAVKQAYITYAPSDKVKFTMGKWATHVGYELLDAYLNRNYSMSYMFSYGPFSHTGLKADFTLGEGFGAMIGVANPTDFVSAPFAKKNLIAQVSKTSEKVNAYLNYVVGKDLGDNLINQVGLTATIAVAEKFGIGYDGTIKSFKDGVSNTKSSWWGSALYLNIDPSSTFGLTARGEYFGDKDGLAGFGTGIFNGTLSANIHVGNLTIIPEFRVDAAKDPVFYKNSDLTAPSSKTSGQFILAATYHF